MAVSPRQAGGRMAFLPWRESLAKPRPQGPQRQACPPASGNTCAFHRVHSFMSVLGDHVLAYLYLNRL